MDKRKEKILSAIIKEHIKTGAPVGSGGLVEKYKLKVSSATVRNEMSSLEEEGYICQPHTSAGRVPTEAAYRFYIGNLGEKKISDADAASIDQALSVLDESSFKQTAKLLSSMSGNAVFWAFHRHNLYYTGISNLLQQPEFTHTSRILDISAVIDRVDEIINDIFEDVDEGVRVMIGEENPFGAFCSTLISKYRLNGHIGLFGMLGPMRSNYERNLAIMRHVDNKLRTQYD